MKIDFHYLDERILQKRHEVRLVIAQLQELLDKRERMEAEYRATQHS